MQRVLDRSLSSATSFTHQYFHRWDAGNVASFVNRVGDITIATVSPRGRPHVAPVIAGCVDGEIHFTASFGSAMLRNIEKTAYVAFRVSDGERSVIGQGTAVLAGRSSRVRELIERLAGESPKERSTPSDWDGLIYRIQAERMFVG